jgi:fatty-acid desaturase
MVSAWATANHISLGWVVGWLAHNDIAAAMRSGTSVLIWGVFVRTVLCLHITWSVNAVCHLWDYRNYDTDNESKATGCSACLHWAMVGTTTIMLMRTQHGWEKSGASLT